MSKQSPDAVRELRRAAADAAAAFGAATDAVDSAAAELLGVNRTDLRILGLVGEAGTMAAGTLATAAGLSPPATTTAIQRLVAAGHLTRRVDDRDRRRAVVALTPPAHDLLNRVYAPIGRAGRREIARYSADELAVILDFLRRGIRLQLGQAERIRTMAEPAGLAALGGSRLDNR
ncbi:MAG TPA: MarR family transcriptional regulator [Actinoplanes sp.]